MTLEQASTSTPNYLIDRLKAILATTTGSNPIIHRPWLNEKRIAIYGDRKYYNEAFDFLSVGACKPVPKFIIYLSDISEIAAELFDLDRISLRYVSRQAVARLFEDIDSSLYHNSISKVLEVEFR